jgi:hypothetical protein
MGATKIANIYQNQPGTNRPNSMNLGPGAVTVGQSIYETSTTKKARLGERLVVGNRIFRYALNSSAAALHGGYVVGAALLGGATTTAQIDALVAVASLLGDTRIFTTILTTAQAAGLFEDGWVGIEDDSLGDYLMFQIKNNSALTTGITGYLDLYDGVTVALTTSDTLTIMTNPYKNVIVIPHGTTPTAAQIGVAPIPVPASSYFWLQTAGPCACLADSETVVIGQPVTSSDDTDGLVQPYAVITEGAPIGVALSGAASDCVLVDLSIKF